MEEPRNIRYFKCKYNDQVFGRFSGLKPKQAANKALTSIIKSNEHNENKIRFEMIECTRGEHSRVICYEGYREKLEKPFEVVIGENKIMYAYKNVVRKINSEEYLKKQDQDNDNNDNNDNNENNDNKDDNIIITI